MVIRPATLSDANSIICIAIQQTEKYPRMRADGSKIKALVIDAISAARHYALVVEEDIGDDGQKGIYGVLLAFTTNNAWALRRAIVGVEHTGRWSCDAPTIS